MLQIDSVSVQFARLPKGASASAERSLQDLFNFSFLPLLPPLLFPLISFCFPAFLTLDLCHQSLIFLLICRVSLLLLSQTLSSKNLCILSQLSDCTLLLSLVLLL